MRAHLPANETDSQNYLPLYQETRRRMEDLFGARAVDTWPLTDDTCSKCYSVTPAVGAPALVS